MTLADLDRRKDEFLAMLAHELRNPLAPHPQCRSNPPPAATRRTICSNRPGASSSGRWSNWPGWWTTCSRSRASPPAGSACTRTLDLRGIVARAVETVRPLIDPQQHELDVSLPPEPVWVDGDADPAGAGGGEPAEQRRQIHRGRRPDRSWLDPRAEGDEAVLRVRDTGVGIAPDVLPHVFDLFTQAERSLDRSQGGLGIGLTLVQRLVEMHGGDGGGV